MRDECPSLTLAHAEWTASFHLFTSRSTHRTITHLGATRGRQRPRLKRSAIVNVGLGAAAESKGGRYFDPAALLSQLGHPYILALARELISIVWLKREA